MRLFLAIPIEGAAARTLAAIQDDLKIGRPVDPDDFHLTLVFLGEVDGPRAEELDAEVSSAVLPAVSLEIAGIGHFGHGAPRAVWAGVTPTPELTRLQAKLAQAARRAGIEVGRRRFVPHVTLSRLKGRPEDAAAVAGFSARNGRLRLQAEAPRAVTLYASHLRAEGPLYEPLEDYPLG